MVIVIDLWHTVSGWIGRERQGDEIALEITVEPTA